MSRFDEIKTGDTAQISHTITEKDIDRFIDLTGDDNKIHTDKDFASRTSFKKPVAHGMLSASFISTIIGTKIPGDGALWLSQSLEFILPVRIDDTILVNAKVISRDERNKIIELETEIFNQHKQKVITGKSRVQVIEEAVSENNLLSDLTPPKKVALVLGGSGGIGSATAIMLSEAGYDVAIHYNKNREKAEKILSQIKNSSKTGMMLQADLLDESSLETLLNEVETRLGPITLFANCSTTSIHAIELKSLDWNDISKQLDVNIKSNFMLMKHLLPRMKERKNGKIIFLSTAYTDSAPPANLLHYVTGKHALIGLAKSLAIECAPFNIEVNIVSPGMTDTDLIADIPEKYRLLMAAKTPLKRLASPQDIAKVITFLGTQSSFITGETIRVNGGFSMV
ncbi:MAG TPA: SDR family oxidoreductase [Oligoflexia bacterium]|nr:SDR family oxidoreductase [Oligoflexia bacterium]HMP48511.1 SDR family oxidoreductase [Oligoflexia bacterium]